MSTGPVGEPRANQLRLVAELARVRARLEAALGGEPARDDTTERAAQRGSALDRLVDVFGLSAFERDVLLLCVGVETDARIPPLIARLSGEARRTWPTFGMALAVLAQPHWSALHPSGPLRASALVELGEGPILTARPLSLPEAVLHRLVGLPAAEALHTAVVSASPPLHLPTAWLTSAARIAADWRRAPRARIHLSGSDGEHATQFAAAIVSSAGRSARVVRARDLPGTVGETSRWAAAWVREALLDNLVLIVEGRPEGTQLAAYTWLIERMDADLMLAAEVAPPVGSRPVLTVSVPRVRMAEQQAVWAGALNSKEPMADVLAELSRRFDLSPGRIQTIAAAMPAEEQLVAACRAAARPQLGPAAQRIEPGARWEDLVLPAAAQAQLRGLLAHARHRRAVAEAWGGSRRQDGTTALFSGPSGTGKSLAAEVIASALELDLFRVDLSAIISKYIGETEKNLREVFDGAEGGAAVLLFDEADALFGRRTETRDSHDRYANQEVSYLLQRMEAYGGIAILTTNLRKALDPAFLRRLRFVVEFPFPDGPAREALWRRAFPPGIAVEGLDWARLASLNVTGANIRDIAVLATVSALDTGRALRTEDVLVVARAELEKLGRPGGGRA